MNDKIKKIIIATNPKKSIIKNMLKAFIIGGSICLVAQGLLVLFQETFKLDKTLSSNLSVTIMVFLGSLLTGLGVYDKIAQFAGAGTIVPITGFANSMTSAAMESSSEGMFVGILANTFKLAGSVIVTGVVSGYLVGSAIYLFRVIFNG